VIARRDRMQKAINRLLREKGADATAATRDVLA